MSYLRRVLQATFTLASGGFAGTQPATTSLNTLKTAGLRMSAKSVNAGGAAMGELQLTIYGMKISEMNTLSTLGMRVQQVPIRNTVTLLAGDSSRMPSVVFEGGIQSAYADLDGQPEACFRMIAKSGLPQAVTAYASSSYEGSADVADVLKKMATQNGLAFENNGVSVIMPDQHYYGSVRKQIETCCNNCGIGWSIDRNTLIIWPRNGSRTGAAIRVAPDTGMINYPAYSAMGIRVRSIFNPAIKFQGKIEVESDQVKKPLDGLQARTQPFCRSAERSMGECHGVL
jgi:hypothetical protein